MKAMAGKKASAAVETVVVGTAAWDWAVVMAVVMMVVGKEAAVTAAEATKAVVVDWPNEALTQFLRHAALHAPG